MSQRLPTKYLSERQKRRLKQKVVKGFQGSLYACSISKSPSSFDSNIPNIQNTSYSGDSSSQQNLSNRNNDSINPSIDNFGSYVESDSSEETQFGYNCFW